MSNLGPQISSVKNCIKNILWNIADLQCTNSAVQQSDSVICIFTFFFRFFSIVVCHRIFKKLHFNMISSDLCINFENCSMGIFLFFFTLHLYSYTCFIFSIGLEALWGQEGGIVSWVSINTPCIEKGTIYFLMSYSIHFKNLDH